MEAIESRVLLSGGPEPITLEEEVIVPGNLQVGAAPQNQRDPYITNGPDGTSLALWTDFRTGGHPSLYNGINNGTMGDIWASRIAADGSLIDQVPINITHDGWHQNNAKAAWNGSNWLVVWKSEQTPHTNYVHAARLAPDGTLLDAEPILIMDDRFLDQYGNPEDPDGPLDVQPNGQGWVVTWRRSEPGGPHGSQWVHYGTRVASDGTVIDTEGQPLFAGSSLNSTWIGLAYSPSNGGQFLQVHRLSSQMYLTRRDSSLNVISSGTAGGIQIDNFYSQMVGSPAGWLVASRAGSSINAWRIDASGVPAPQQVVASTSADPRVGAAFDGNGYVINYATAAGADYNVFGRRMAFDGTMAPPALIRTLDNPVYDLNSVGHDQGRYSALLADSSGGTTDIAIVNVAGDDSVISAADVSNAARAHSSPDVASDGTNFLAVFHSFNQDEDILMGVRLNNQGQPLETEPFTIVPNAWDPGGYQVVHFGDRYVVTFTGTGPQGTMIYAQQVGSDGQLIGSPVALTDGMAMGDASVLNDRLLVAGNSKEGSLQASRRFGRIFDLSLQPVTDRFEFGSGFVLSGDAAPVGDRWLAAWSWKSSHDAPRAGIAYNYISTDGTRSGPVTLVASYPDNGAPTVVSAGPGAAEAMIAFSRLDPPPEFPGTFFFPNSGEGIVGQRMAADGTRIGGLITLIDEAGISAGVRATFDGSNYVLTWIDSRNHQFPRQEQPDVFAARVAIDGTVLDPGGFAVAASERPEDSMVAASGGGHTFFVFRQFRYEKPYAAYRITTRLLDDIHAPVTSTDPVFDQNGAGAGAGQAGPNVGIAFWERLYDISSADLVVRNVTTNQTIDPASLAQVERVGAGGQWEYGWIHNGGALPDGRYTATLPAGSVLDKAGNPLAEPLVIQFTFLSGDANGDARVDLADFNILAANFGQSNRTFSQGDFNYDGMVNLADFNILAQRFGTIIEEGEDERDD